MGPILLLLAVALAYAWWSSARQAAERAEIVGRNACQAAGVQWLDQTVHADGLRLRRRLLRDLWGESMSDPVPPVTLVIADAVRADIERKLTANHRLMASLGLQATPAMVWRDANGAVQMRTGAPPSEIPAILGPR